jgi:hypothetical protein
MSDQGRALYGPDNGRAQHSPVTGRAIFRGDTLIIWSTSGWLYEYFTYLPDWEQRIIDATYYGCRNRGNPVTVEYDPTTDDPPWGWVTAWSEDNPGGLMPWSYNGEVIFPPPPGHDFTRHRKVVWYFDATAGEWRVDFLAAEDYGVDGFTVNVVHRFAISGAAGSPPDFHDRYLPIIGDGSIKDVYVRHHY